MKSIINKVIKSGAGATTIEYSLLAAILAIGAIVSFEAMGLKVQRLFQTVDSSYENREGLN
jgi:Flp pilus assembly pilin Flp